MSDFWETLTTIVAIALGFLCMREAGDAKNWPTQIGWVLIAFFMFAVGIARAAS